MQDEGALATDPDDCPEVCLQCGEPIEPGSVRWNGRNWEHKSSDAHPQAGHHAMLDVEEATDAE